MNKCVDCKEQPWTGQIHRNDASLYIVYCPCGKSVLDKIECLAADKWNVSNPDPAKEIAMWVINNSKNKVCNNCVRMVSTVCNAPNEDCVVHKAERLME